jgi:hypothetical protein
VKDWGEGVSDAPDEEGAGAPSDAGDATWIHTYYDTGLWDYPGGDVLPSPSATITIDGQGFFTFESTPAMEADLQYWYCNPCSNFGWILIGDESSPGTAVRFDSRESPDSLFRPELRYDLYTCDCFASWEQGDLDKDYFLTALDLGMLIDALFAGGANPTDCGAYLGDVDCSHFTDALDLSLLIDVLFVGAYINCESYYMFDECGEVCTGIQPSDKVERVRRDN